MLDPKTIDGLDGAMGDLNNAIEALPDGPLKRQLTQRFNRMRRVRDHLEDEAECREARSPLPYILFGFGLAIALVIAWKTRPSCR